MSTLAEIRDIAEKVLGAALPQGSVERVNVEEAFDEEGMPSLSVTAVVKPAAAADGDAILDAQLDARVDLQKRLSDAGEERFAYVRLVTREELDVES